MSDDAAGDPETSTAASALARYNEADWLRFAIQKIPLIGPSLDLLLTSGHRRLAQQRARYLLAGLEADVQRIDGSKVDNVYVESEEFHDLLIAAIRNSIETRHREKIRLNARILAGAIRSDQTRDEPELHLELIRDLSPQDLVVLREIVAQQRIPPDPTEDNLLAWASRCGWDRIHATVLKQGVRDVPHVLHRLQGAGCIKEITGGFFDYTGGTYLLTDAARRLVVWLEARGGFPTEEDISEVEDVE